MPKSKTYRLSVYIAVNLAMAIILFTALHVPSQGAQNVYVFMTWFSLLATLGMKVSDDVKKSWIARGGRSVPEEVSWMIDLLFVLTLVFFGWWWTAIAHFVSTVLGQVAMDEAEKLSQEPAKQ